MLTTTPQPNCPTAPCFIPGGGSDYGNQANFVSGTVTGTDTTLRTIIGAPATTGFAHITGVQCARDDAGTTAIHVTLNDSASTPIILPNNGGGGGNNPVFTTPLVVAVNTALKFQASASITTVYCSAQGYDAP